MASISRSQNDSVLVSGAVFRAVVDLAQDWPDIDSEVAWCLDSAYPVKGIALDLLEPTLRERMVSALTFAVAQAVQGERSSRSREDAADGEILVSGAERIRNFFDTPA